jgi:hypothetical protein
VRSDTGLSKAAVVLLLVLALFLPAAGCHQPAKKPMTQQSSSKSKLPPNMTQIIDNLDKMYGQLQMKPAAGAQSGQQQSSQGQSGSQQSSGQNQAKQGENSGKTGQGESQNQQQTQQTASQMINWAGLTKMSVKLHQLWNKVEPQVVQAGAGPEAVSAFEQSLNTLPAKLAAKDRQGALAAVNQASIALPDLLRFFESKVPPDLYLLVAQGRVTLERCEEGNWSGAEAMLPLMNTSWSQLRSAAKGEKQEEAGRVQFSLTDLQQAVKDQDKHLTAVKEQILEQNIKSLGKSLQKQSGM